MKSATFDRMSPFTPAMDVKGRFGTSLDHEPEPPYDIAPDDAHDIVRNDDPEHAPRHQWGLFLHRVGDPDAGRRRFEQASSGYSSPDS